MRAASQSLLQGEGAKRRMLSGHKKTATYSVRDKDREETPPGPQLRGLPGMADGPMAQFSDGQKAARKPRSQFRTPGWNQKRSAERQYPAP